MRHQYRLILLFPIYIVFIVVEIRAKLSLSPILIIIVHLFLILEVLVPAATRSSTLPTIFAFLILRHED